jgi:hypothetical protein
MRRVAVAAISVVLASCAASTSSSPEREAEPLRLRPTDISKVVMAHYPAFRGCYDSSASASKAGVVSIAFTVAPDGVATKVREGIPSLRQRAELKPLKDAALTRCFFRVIAKIRFPEAKKSTEASWTFVFKPDGS